ncbi:MAG: 3-phosphoserine/phosphohydroxythreonine transaminase [Phycisphaerae bacterium]|nr:3-phosphoserine/phosphohydroxythreonine transaminase [Phycisphaerae bacterium]
MPSDAPRKHNFSAGPSTLPDDVLMAARDDIWSLHGTGIGILEHSHRGATFDRVLHETFAALRTVSGISDDYEIVLMPGGATVQFALLPMNFLRPGQKAAFVDTSIWTRVAYDQAVKQVPSTYIWTAKSTNYDRIPKPGELPDCSGYGYVQYCTNNTVEGSQFLGPLEVNAPTVCDASSDIFSRPYDYSKHAIVLACAQKNLGPSGNTVMFIRRDWLEASRDDVSPILSFRENAKAESRLNTPNTFGIYLIGQVCRWLIAQGGMPAMGKRNAEKAKILYDAIDGSGGFYKGTAQTWCRSMMNVTFRIANESLEAHFIAEATDHGLDGLTGHRSVGGMRASIYNAVPKAACEALVGFMQEFQRRNG